MRNFLVLLKKELYHIFSSPGTFLVIALSLLLMGYFFCYFLGTYDYMYNEYQSRIGAYLKNVTQQPSLAQQLVKPEPPDFTTDVIMPFYFWFTFIMLFI